MLRAKRAAGVKTPLRARVPDARARDELHELERELVCDETMVRKRCGGLGVAHALPGAGPVTAKRRAWLLVAAGAGRAPSGRSHPEPDTALRTEAHTETDPPFPVPPMRRRGCTSPRGPQPGPAAATDSCRARHSGAAPKSVGAARVPAPHPETVSSSGSAPAPVPATGPTSNRGCPPRSRRALAALAPAACFATAPPAAFGGLAPLAWFRDRFDLCAASHAAMTRPMAAIAGSRAATKRPRAVRTGSHAAMTRPHECVSRLLRRVSRLLRCVSRLPRRATSSLCLMSLLSRRVSSLPYLGPHRRAARSRHRAQRRITAAPRRVSGDRGWPDRARPARELRRIRCRLRRGRVDGAPRRGSPRLPGDRAIPRGLRRPPTAL